VFLDHYRDFQSQLLVTAYDVWPISKYAESARKGEILWVCYAFIDWEWTDNNFILERLDPALKVVPTSKWLERELLRSGLKNVSPPIYLGVNHDVYKPIIGTKDEKGGKITKERLRRSLGFPPTSFVILILQMNQIWRKPFELQFEGIQLFRSKNPDVDVRVWCHCIPRARDNWSLPELAREYGLDHNRGDIKFADSYTILKGLHGYNEDHMSKLINSADCLLHCTTGDSPGMPVIEAMSCGVPVVATDFVALHELLEPHLSYA